MVYREFEQGGEVDEPQLEQQVDDQFAADVDAEIDALDNEIDELWALFEENEGDIESQPDSLRQKLAAWAVKRNILHNAVDELLGILKEQPCGVGLPKSARTLVGTIRDVLVRKVNPGLYYHFGILEGAKSVLQKSPLLLKLPQKIKFFVFVDCLPISDSSGGQFWPILMMPINVRMRIPFLVGLYYGEKKPLNANELII